MTTYTVPYGGGRIDIVAKRLLQTEQRGALEALLSANPGLVSRLDAGFALEGEVIVVPEDFTAKAPSAGFVLAWE